MKIIKYSYLLVILSFLSINYAQAQLDNLNNSSKVKPLSVLALRCIAHNLLENAPVILELSQLNKILKMEDVSDILSSFTPDNMSKILVIFVECLENAKTIEYGTDYDILDIKLKIKCFLDKLNNELEPQKSLNQSQYFNRDKIVDIIVKDLEEINKVKRGHRLLELLNNSKEKSVSYKEREATALIGKGLYNINIQDNRGYAALHFAASKYCYANPGYLNIARLLINNDSDVNIQDYSGNTPLMVARGFEMVKLLIDAGADIHIKNNDGNTVLMQAWQDGHVESIICGKTVSLYAWYGKPVEIVKLLLGLGANVNIINKGGNTTLMVALKGGCAKVVKLLIDAGVNVNAVDKNGNTALMYACYQGYIEIVEVLISAYANINSKNKYGETALMLAVENEDIKLAKLLVDKGASINPQDIDSKAAYENLVKFLRNPIQ